LLRPACPAAAALHGQLRPAWSAARVAVLGALQPAGCGRARPPGAAGPARQISRWSRGKAEIF